MPVAIAFIPLLPNAKLSPSAIKADWKQRWPDCGELQSEKPEKDILSFRAGDKGMLLGVMRAPIPWSDLEGPCATSVLWPNAAEQLRPCVGHIIVTLLNVEDPLEQARWLTRMCASTLAACKEAPGVYWGNATLVVPSAIFIDFATEIMPGIPPLDIWVDFRVGPNEAGKTSGFTTGMKALGLMEFETETASDSPADLRERFSGLARYLLENGPVIKDGDTVGEDEHEKIRVVYAPSSFGQEGPVMRLDYTSSAPVKKKGWW